MAFVITAACVAGICSLIVFWTQRNKQRSNMEQHSITPESLYAALVSNQEILIFGEALAVAVVSPSFRPSVLLSFRPSVRQDRKLANILG